MRIKEDLFLEMLDCEAVKEKIKVIVASMFITSSEDSIQVLSTECVAKDEINQSLVDDKRKLEYELYNANKKLNNLQEQYDILQRELEEKRVEKQNLISENARLKTIIEQNIDDRKNKEVHYTQIEKILDSYTAYEDMHCCYETYRNLVGKNNNIQRDLVNVLSVSTPERFFMSGFQWNNIVALWDYMSYKIDSFESTEMKDLQQIFDFLFIKFNEIENRYERIVVNIGDELNDEIHARHNSSKLTGKVNQIYLNGYINKKTGKVERKSIVSAN